MTNIETIKELLSEAMELASKTITLCEDYSGGESETLEYFTRKFDELEVKVWDAEDSIPLPSIGKKLKDLISLLEKSDETGAEDVLELVSEAKNLWEENNQEVSETLIEEVFEK